MAVTTELKKALKKFYKGFALVNEEVDIAKRGEFSTQTDIQYLVQGATLLNEFKEELEKLLK